MSTTTTSSRMSYVQWLIESRPPCLTWSRSSPPQPISHRLTWLIKNPTLPRPQHRTTEASAGAWSRHAGPPNGGPDYRMPESGAPHLDFDSVAAGPAFGRSGHSLKRALADPVTSVAVVHVVGIPVLGQPCVGLSAGGNELGTSSKETCSAVG